MFMSLPYEPRRIQATEARLERIYAAAKRGLKGESLAISAGMLPAEFNQISQLDPLVNLAAQKGRADAEQELSDVLHTAALAGDAKMALEILKHQHGWVAKQQIEVNQVISITAALQEAEQRVINMGEINADDDLFSDGRTSLNGEAVDAVHKE